MEDHSQAFTSLSEALNTTFSTSSTSAIDTAIATIEQKKNEIVTKQNKEEALKDAKYLEFELKDLISLSKNVLSKLETDIKLGSPPRMHEVYARMAEALVLQIRELRELNKVISDMEYLRGNLGGEDQAQKQSANITMTADELLKLVKSAEKQSELNRVDATFEIKDE